MYWMVDMVSEEMLAVAEKMQHQSGCAVGTNIEIGLGRARS